MGSVAETAVDPAYTHAASQGASLVFGDIATPIALVLVVPLLIFAEMR